MPLFCPTMTQLFVSNNIDDVLISRLTNTPLLAALKHKAMNLYASFLFLNVGNSDWAKQIVSISFSSLGRSIYTCGPKVHERSRWKGSIGKVHDRTEVAMKVFDNSDSECCLKAQRLLCAPCLTLCWCTLWKTMFFQNNFKEPQLAEGVPIKPQN